MERGFGATVWTAALLGVLGRFPGMLWPLRPDEAGFILVARAWSPEPDSLYGHYWVDRPPQIIAVAGAADWLGGPYGIRLLGALACALLVLASAAAAREVARHAGAADAAVVRRSGAWAAVVAAALVVNPEIDAISTKGELLGLPLVVTACWLALRAVRLLSWRAAFLGGLAAMLAPGMKQNIVGGLVFGGVVLAGSLLARRLTWAGFGRLAAAAVTGAAVPVLATVGWALAAGVRLETLWFAVVTFRFEASEVIVRQNSTAAESRAELLLLAFVGTGMALAVALFVVRLRGAWLTVPVITAATATMLAVEGVGIVLSGSYWLPYLFLLVPGVVLATATLYVSDANRPRHPRVPWLTRLTLGFIVVSSVVSLSTFTVQWARGMVAVEVETGRAIAEAAHPGDTLVVYGGRADIQWASGMRSPYPYLWSLPMRTLDRGLVDLGELLAGPEAPAWVVEAASIDAWTELGTAPIEERLLRKYELVADACGRYRVYHLNTVDTLELDVDCDKPFRFVW